MMPPRPALAALLLGCVLIAAPATAQEPTGEALFEARCAGCHGPRRVLPPVRERAEADRLPWLDDFLKNHHAPDDAERRAIAEFMAAAAR